MKKLFLILFFLLFTPSAWATKTLTTTVCFQDAQANCLANGMIIFRLSIGAKLISNGQVVNALNIPFTLTAGGMMPAGALLYGNDELLPAGTYYTVTIYNSNGLVVRGPEKWIISGTSPVDLSAITSMNPPSPSFGNAVLQNPTAAQTITGQSLTLTSSAPLITQGTDTLTGPVTATNPCNVGGMIYVSGAGCYTTIQAAVTIAGAGDVYIPAGTYALVSGVTFSSSVKLHGAGKERTIIQVPANITGFANANQASALSFGEISDLSIQLQGNNSIGIDQKALTRWDFNRVRFNHTAGTTGEIGIKFHGGNTVSSFSTNVFECEFNVAAGIGALIVDAANDQRIGPGNTFIVNNTSVGIKIDGTIDSSGASVPNTTRIIGNRFDTTVAGDVAISLSPTLATNDTWIAYNRFESASTSTHIVIGATADSTRLGPNWYTGGTFWTDAGVRTYIFEPRPFGLPINATFDFKWRQNFLIDPADDAETYLRIASGATAAQHARVYFKDNIAAADVWTLDKDASNNWLLYDPVNLHTHLIAVPNGATKLNSFGATKIVFNGNANSSTAGVDFQSGGAVPVSVATIDGTGKFTSLLPTGIAPFVVASITPVANLGIQNCANCVVEHKRVAGCATAAALNATCDTTVTWGNAFADASYTASCTGDVVTSGVPIVEGHSISAAKTGAAITVRTLAITAAAAQFTTLDCLAWHD